MRKDDAIDDIGRLADSIQNIIAAGEIPGIPDRIRLQAMTEAMHDWQETARKAYVALSGENPWNDSEDE